jgi:acyl-CoA reductase-like NAD-dependent aldehyde dehydrogenase
VHEAIYDELCQEMARLAKEVKVGDALEADTELGPL